MVHSELGSLVRSHYRRRGFPGAIVDLITAEAERRSGSAGLEIAPGWWAPIESLAETFQPIDQTPTPAACQPEPGLILGLAFGHRLESPFSRRPEERRPGPNNIALAKQIDQCRLLFPDAWVAVQYEVGLALEASTRQGSEAALVAPARDWNLAEVLAYVLERVPPGSLARSRRVVVVSHAHQYARAALLLTRAGYEPSPPPAELPPYTAYDTQDAQPRFRSPWQYVLNDFLALCKLAAMPQTSSLSALPPAWANRGAGLHASLYG